MTRHEREGYRRRLKALAGRLTGEVSHLRDEVLRPAGADSSPASPTADVVNREGEEEVALAALGVEEFSLAEVAAALARLDEGGFGFCTACGRRIAKARLELLPFSRYCIRCARRREAGTGP